MGAGQQDLTSCVMGFYKLEEPIGSPGAQGRTYKATHVTKKEPAAVKILTDPTEEDIEHFKREAELLGSLSHPNIQRIIDHDYDQHYHVFYIAKNLVEGVPLTNVLRARGNSLRASKSANFP